MKKVKKILSVIIWPIIFIVGQIFIKYPFVAYFNSLELNTIKNNYPTLSNQELNTKLLTTINTTNYQNRLNDFLNSKALIITLITFIIFGLIFYNIYRKIKNSEHKSVPIVKLILIGIMISLFYNIFIFNINNVVHITDSFYISKVSMLILVLTTGIMGPILEELLFRGIVFNRLKTIVSINKSIIFTSLLFGICHLPNLVNTIYAILLSFILVKVYLKYKTLKAPILIHCSCNIITNLYLPILLNNFILNYLLIIISIIGLMIVVLNSKNKM